MDIDNLLTIGGFVFSALGCIISMRSLRKGRKFTVIAGIVMILVVSTGISVYRLRQHNTLTKQVEKEIVETLANGSLTLDEIHERLLYRSFPEVTEALFNLTKDASIRHRLLRLHHEGALMSVRVYFQSRQEETSGGETISGRGKELI